MVETRSHGGRFDAALMPPPADAAALLGLELRRRGRELRGACPLCGGAGREPFCLSARHSAWTCHACGARGGDVIDLLRQRDGIGFADAAKALGAWVTADPDGPSAPSPRPVPNRSPTRELDADERSSRQRKRALAAAIWRQAQPLRAPAGSPATPAECYLEQRGCVLPPDDGDLRFAPELRIFGLAGAFLVGRISAVDDPRRALGLHLTQLVQDGDGWRRGERRYLGAKAGGCIRLWPDEAVTLGLAIGEGIETMLAAAHAFQPAWACMDAGNLAAFPVLAGVESLTVFADNDANGTGLRAAARTVLRWQDAGKEARALMSDIAGADVADEVASWQ